MSTVWVVTSGIYSDFRIEAIFSTEGAANVYAASLGRDYVEVEGWGVNQTFNADTVYWDCCFWDFASNAHCERLEDGWTPDDPRLLNRFERRSNSSSPYYKGYVRAHTQQDAMKIGREYAMMAKAQYEGMG